MRSIVYCAHSPDDCSCHSCTYRCLRGEIYDHCEETYVSILCVHMYCIILCCIIIVHYIYIYILYIRYDILHLSLSLSFLGRLRYEVGKARQGRLGRVALSWVWSCGVGILWGLHCQVLWKIKVKGSGWDFALPPTV